MAEATTLDKPVDTATEAEAPRATEAQQPAVVEMRTPASTDASATVQTEEAPAEPGELPEATAQPDINPHDAEWREAERERIREEERSALRQERDAEGAQKRKAQMGEHFQGALRAATAYADSLGMNAEMRQGLFNLLNGYNLKAVEDLLGPFEEASLAVLPEPKREAFLKAVAGKGPEAYMRQFAHSVAETLPVEDIVKLPSFKDALKASPEKVVSADPTLRAYVADVKRTAYAEGRDKGRGDPNTERSGNERTTSARKTYDTMAALTHAHATNEISNAEFLRQQAVLRG